MVLKSYGIADFNVFAAFTPVRDLKFILRLEALPISASFSIVAASGTVSPRSSFRITRSDSRNATRSSSSSSTSA